MEDESQTRGNTKLSRSKSEPVRKKNVPAQTGSQMSTSGAESARNIVKEPVSTADLFSVTHQYYDPYKRSHQPEYISDSHTLPRRSKPANIQRHFSNSFRVTPGVLGNLRVRDRKRASEGSLRSEKSLNVAYALAVGLGFFGAHHFYLNRPFFGVVYLLTFGLCGLGYIVDLFRVAALVDEINVAIAEQEHLEYSHADAYILWFPCGLLGVHHFFLGNYGQGLVFLFSFGVYGVGWLIDFFRLPSLVATGNTPKGHRSKARSRTVAYLFAISPFGIFGAHHFYLGRWKWGLLYFLTFGMFLVGWVIDFFRVPALVSRQNQIIRGELDEGTRWVDDAYILWIFLGFFGAHHFYLGRKSFAIIYMCSLGLFGFGWVVDFFRIPCLVSIVNNHLGDAQTEDDNNGDDERTNKNDLPAAVFSIAQQEDMDENDLRMIALWLKKKCHDQDLSYFLSHNQDFQDYCNHVTSRGSHDDSSVYVHRRHQRHQNGKVSRSKSSLSSFAGTLGPKPSFRFNKAPSQKLKVQDFDDSSEDGANVLDAEVPAPRRARLSHRKRMSSSRRPAEVISSDENEEYLYGNGEIRSPRGIQTDINLEDLRDEAQIQREKELMKCQEWDSEDDIL